MKNKTTRMHSRAIVVAHSHVKTSESNDGVINLTDDLKTVNVSKQIKGMGGATITLVPRKNYLNILFPNDVINIYFDPGDGKRGFVRTFFGYIDRINRTEQVDEDTGAVQTAFTVICSDFTKAIDKTNIYFNPHLKNRTDFLNNTFGNSLLSGHALRVAGIIAHGTPADMVENFLQILMGFGAQWVLPDQYTKNTRYLKENRRQRKNRARSKIPDSLVSQLQLVTGQDLDTSVLQEESRLIDAFKGVGTVLSSLNNIIAPGQSIDATNTLVSFDRSLVNSIINKNSALNAYRNIVKTILSKDSYNILDLMDLSFIEANAIDGYIASAAVWQQQGTLSSLMYGYSNEIVNELTFDLRPTVVSDSGDGCFGDIEQPVYSTEEDELGINVNGAKGYPASVKAIKYVPAVMFREYPFSTTEGLDLKNVFTTGTRIGFIPFGPIFSLRPNREEPHRIIYSYESVPEIRNELSGTLSPDKQQKGNKQFPLKHLDVIPIYNEDVVRADVGRSDNDIYNLFAIYATDGLQKIYKYLLQEFLPIVTPVSIERNGLRTHEVKTKFANYSRDGLTRGTTGTDGSAVDSGQIRQNLVRWSLLLDHWNQHNNEYLSGTITLRGMPEIRVGYRLDWVDRKESYYVEHVSHSFIYGQKTKFTTNVQVSRGQRNDPFPAWVPPRVSASFGTQVVNPVSPIFDGLNVTLQSDFSKQGGGNRTREGRLGQYFKIKDTKAIMQPTKSDSGLDNVVDLPPVEQGTNSRFPGIILYSTGQFGYFSVPREQRDDLTQRALNALSEGIAEFKEFSRNTDTEDE